MQFQSFLTLYYHSPCISLAFLSLPFLFVSSSLSISFQHLPFASYTLRLLFFLSFFLSFSLSSLSHYSNCLPSPLSTSILYLSVSILTSFFLCSFCLFSSFISSLFFSPVSYSIPASLKIYITPYCLFHSFFFFFSPSTSTLLSLHHNSHYSMYMESTYASFSPLLILTLEGI